MRIHKAHNFGAAMVIAVSIWAFAAPADAQFRSTRSVQAQPVPCPSGTQRQADRSCLIQNNRRVISTRSLGRTQAGFPVSRARTHTNRIVDPCPSGTLTQSDGSCLKNRSFSTNRAHTPISTRGYYPAQTAHHASFPSQIDPCPAGTITQPDQSCLRIHQITVTGGPYGGQYGAGQTVVATGQYYQTPAQYSLSTPAGYTSYGHPIGGNAQTGSQIGSSAGSQADFASVIGLLSSAKGVQARRYVIEEVTVTLND